MKTFEFVYANTTSIKEEAGLTVFVNKFSDNKFFLGIGNAANEKVTIKIIDQNDKEIYTADELVANQFSQLFNFDVLITGITFKVYKNNKLIKELSF